MIDGNLLSTGESNIAAETCVRTEEDNTTTRQDEKRLVQAFALYESLSSIMIMTAVERLLAIVRDRKRERERENLNDDEGEEEQEEEEEKEEEKMPGTNDEMCDSANTHLRPARQRIILQ